MLQFIRARSGAEAHDESKRAKGARVEFKAGGTDTLDRHRNQALAPSTLVELGAAAELHGIRSDDTSLVIGAMAPLARVAEDAAVGAEAPLLTAAILRTATPQIRELATLGGSLCQRPRCAYLRNHEFHCAKEGGERCFARTGEHGRHAIFDNDVCSAPHPSTPGLALLALDAELLVLSAPDAPFKAMPMAAFFAVDVNDATIENALAKHDVIVGARIPRASPDEDVRIAYERASARELADWADVEAAVSLAMRGGRITKARVALGGVGRVPRRAVATEKMLEQNTLTPALLTKAARASTEGARVMEQNGHKVPLCQGTVLAALTRSLA